MKTLYTIRHAYILAALILCQITSLLKTESPFYPYWHRPRYQANSFIYTRPLAQNIAMQQALWHSIAYDKHGQHCAGIQLYPVFQDAGLSKENNKYFLLNCRSSLLVSGDDNVNDHNIRDVRAEWLQLPADFRGTMSIGPTQRQAGVIFEYHQDVERLFNINFLHDYWVSIVMPVQHIENNMDITQSNMQNTSAHYPHDIIQAFNNNEWHFARINGKKSSFEVGDFFIRMGKTYYNQNGFQLLFYGGFTIPTTKQQNPLYIFSPVAGLNGHCGAIFGTYMDFLLSECSCPWAISFFMACEGIYLLRNSQYRTFDIVCKPLSRYLLFVRRGGHKNEYYPGPNVLTRNVRAHPYTLSDFACGWRAKNDYFEWELGYGIWGHGEEKLQLTCDYDCNNDGLYGIAGKAPAGYSYAVTANDSTINYQAPYDVDEQGHPAFVGVSESELDLHSAASRSALNHKIFMSCGALGGNSCIDYLFGAGVYVEIPQWCTSLHSWGVWIKSSATF